MAPPAVPDELYSATYSGVPVFEFNTDGNHVMRRRHDHYINATHILKAAGHDKPQRTRILEREVQKNIHEKIQGGYGKYQGTWIPLEDGRLLAQRNGVLDQLRPIFDYVPGDISPPQAPKHVTNSNKPRAPKASNPKKPQKRTVNPNYSQRSEDHDMNSNQLYEDESIENSTIASQSFIEEDDTYGGRYNQMSQPSRKRKRERETEPDEQHRFYADALLDYFMLSDSDTAYSTQKPRMPDVFDINKPIDESKHTVLHWAASMGDTEIVGDCLDRGAEVFAPNLRGETPLIRAVHFTNNFEKGTMPRLLRQLSQTVRESDIHGASILHHIAMTTNSFSKKQCARHYFDVVLNRMAEDCGIQEFSDFINRQDGNGDTALHIVARHGSKKCIRALQGRGARGDIYNSCDETADEIMQKTRSVRHDFISSSPVPAPTAVNGQELLKGSKTSRIPHYNSQSAQSFSQSFGSMAQDKGLQVALAFEHEVRQKDDNLSESQRMLLHVENERQQMRDSFLKQAGEDFDGTNIEEDQIKQQEEQRSERESKSLSEQIQHKDLHTAIRSEERNLPLSAHNKTNGVVFDDGEVDQQGLAAYILIAEQGKRRKLTTTVATAEAAAGMSAYGEDLKQLISRTCGIPTEDVASVAPEMLDELQESKMDAVSNGILAGAV